MRSVAVPGRYNGGPTSITTATTTIATSSELSLPPSVSGAQNPLAVETAFVSPVARSSQSIPVVDLSQTSPVLTSPDVTASAVSSSLRNPVLSKQGNGSRNTTPPRCTPRETPTKLTPRNSAPVSPRLVLPEGPETDLTEI
ncbi:hypothetical protein FHG87_008193, partial [Trinorchestia longiramus]